MTFWDQVKKQLTAIIDLPIEAAQGAAVRKQAYVTPSGSVASTGTFTYPKLSQNPQISKTRVVREPTVGRTAYSHGLEKIYTLETVDPKSIRVMGTGDTAKQSNAPIYQKMESEPQSELDFGPVYRQWITPCFLLEPIHVLGLSTQTEKLFRGIDKNCVGDLINFDFAALVHVKGFGQGHIDEVQSKLRKYVGERHCQKSTQIDWPAWLRSMTSQLSLKEAKVFLDQFALGTSISVPAHIAMELRRISKEERKMLYKQALEVLRKTKLNDVNKRWSEILQAFVLPWMYLREGVASTGDLIERLECVSTEPEYVDKVLKLLCEITGYESSFANDLVPVEENLYAVNAVNAGLVIRVLDLTKTYFYTAESCYQDTELSFWLARELAKDWVDCTQERISKLLSYTSMLTSYRSSRGLVYKLSLQR